jgi:hypothetical protein
VTRIQDMVQFVTSDPDFSALAGDRLYPISLPQEPIFPAATYFRVARPHEHTHDGGETVHPLFQFDCYGRTYLEADQLAHIIDDLFGRWKSAWGDAAFGEDLRDIPEPNLPPIGARFRKILDVTIWGLY